MTEGVVLKLSTEAASRGMREFDAVSKATLDTLAQQNRLLTSLEQTFRRQADAEAAATRAAESAASARTKANASLAASFDIYGGGSTVGGRAGSGNSGPRNLNVIADGLLNVGKKAETAANGTAAATAKAAPLVQKFAGALGGSAGLSRAFGAVGGAAQLFLGAINPLGIAVGLAAGVVLDFAVKLASAETPLEKAARLAKEAQQNFDLVGDSAKKASDAIVRAADATDKATGTGSIESQLRAAEERLKAFQDAADLQETASGRGQTSLNLRDIAALAQSIRASEQVIQALGQLATKTGLEYDKALAVVRAAGIPIAGDRRQTNANSVSFQRGGLVIREDQGTVTLAATKAQELLNNAIGEASTQLIQLRRAQSESLKPLQDIGAALAREAEFAGLGNKEREVSLKLRDLEIAAGERFSSSQQQVADSTLAAARAIDKQVATQQASLNQLARQQQQYDAARQFQGVQGGLRDQITFLQAGPAEREQLLLQQRIKAEQQAAGVTPGSLAGGQIKAQVEELSNLEKAEQSFQRLKDLGRDTFDTIANSIGQAVLQSQNLRQVLSSVGNNISQLLLSRAIGAASNAIFGPSTPAQLGRVLPSRWMMGGGILDRSQTIVSGGYAINVAEGGGASPEAILPLARDNFGRLGVRGEGGGGGAVILNLPNVRSGEDARRVRPTLTQTVESVNRRSRRTLRAGR